MASHALEGGGFYPEKIRSSDVLSFYVGQFETVEINNSFYQIPAKETLEQWRDTVPADFFYIRLHGPEGTYQGSYDT